MNDKVKKNSALIWLLLSIFLMSLDQWTKAIAIDSLKFEGNIIPFIDNFWNWKLAYNPGAAFSLFADAGPWAHWFFVIMLVGVSSVLVVMLSKIPRNRWYEALPYSLVIAGALGNLIDRFRFGKVVDFIEWYYRDFHWPVFNIADSCIVAGACILILFSFRKKEEEK